MTRSHRIALALALAGAIVAGATSPTVPATAEHRRIAAGGTPAVQRTGHATRRCGLLSALAVSVRALSTPLVGQDLVLEVTTGNGRAAGAVRSSVRLPTGLDAAADAAWVDVMTQGQIVRHRVTVRVTSGAPLALTAKAASLDPAAAAEPPGEGYLTLYPLELTPGGVQAHWSATTLRALDDLGPPAITMRTGDRAVIIHGDE